MSGLLLATSGDHDVVIDTPGPVLWAGCFTTPSGGVRRGRLDQVQVGAVDA